MVEARDTRYFVLAGDRMEMNKEEHDARKGFDDEAIEGLK